MLYELEFFIGNTSCTLIEIQPYNTPSLRQGRYYEHYHSCFELHYVESGSAEYICGKKNEKVRAGELLIIPPRMYHKEISASDANVKMTLTLNIKKPENGDVSKDIDFYSCVSHENTTVIPISNTPLGQKLIQLKELATNTKESYLAREKMRALIHGFSVDLYEYLTEDSSEDASYASDTTVVREHKIDTFIALNFMLRASRDELAEHLHVSPRQLHRIVKKSYGKTYREKLSEIRLEIALGFLETTDKSISEIAEELGYSSNASFTTFIKTSTGKTPSEIRRERQAKGEE